MRFNSGEAYRYDDVPMDKVETMLGAKSPGGFFASRIKGLHPATKL